MNKTIYLVDDDAALADSMIFLLANYGYQVTWFADGHQFLTQVDLHQTACVLLDAKMPLLSGEEVHRALQQAQSSLGVVFLTGHGDVPMAVQALTSGAVDFLQKPATGAALTVAIEKALLISDQRCQQWQQQQRLHDLSSRETEILQLTLQGQTNKQMAEQLCLAVRTIEVHRAKMMQKLQVQHISELFQYRTAAESFSSL